MPGLRYQAVVGCIAATLLLVGCGGAVEATPQTRAKATPTTQSPSASASPPASLPPTDEKTRKQVLSDLRIAAEGIGELNVTQFPPEAEPCHADVQALLPGVPGKTELRLAVRRLEKRGWQLDGSEPVEEMAFLDSGVWNLIVGVGPVPEEAQAKTGSNRGALVLSASGRCS